MKYWFLTAVSLACAASWGDARQDLGVRLGGLGHMAAEFTQRIAGAHGELIEESRGYVRLLAPNLRWEVTQPHALVLVAAGDELRLYDPDLEQVTVRPLSEVLDDTPLALLTRGATVPGEEYDVLALDADRFSVKPRSEDALFAEIVLQFGAPGLIGMLIVDHLGQTTDIRFHRFQDASVIQSADFELNVPPGTDVL